QPVDTAIKKKKDGGLVTSDKRGKQEVDFNRKTRRNSYIPISISPIRKQSKPFSAKKYYHSQKLLKWIPKRFHDYYKNLQYQNNEDDE
ncbi:hypothetical protein ILUMI_16908, partial [Ignelater luminosus]